ncbi:MAG: DNA replication complex GINS family protein [Candidatus Bathyarchaeota archaeon]|nr:MAG: DNA replication complex GINS family protein [Candidatus Bathyarchaeota archaeon]
MYNELYAAWRFEIENTELGSLPPDFYIRTAEYLRKIKQENRMLDKKTVKASLLEHEMQHVKHMLQELVWMRYEKMIKIISENQKIPSDLLTTEEAKICAGFLSFTEAYHRFAKNLLRGQVLKVKLEKAHKRVALRFIKEIPAVIGADMKTYGPFLVEDVASVPVENAKILIKQGLAELVEAS